jgi:IS30 family transposase
MARTTPINDSEKRYMDRLHRKGWSFAAIARHFGRCPNHTEKLIKEYNIPYRKVTKQECNPKFSTENDSGPKIRCRCCGNLATRVCKSDAKKCVACDMRQNVLRNENGDSRRF